jgi:predicted DNA-binding transcriptional regulator AlpA
MPDPLAGLPPRFLRTPEAARFLGLSGRTLEKHRTYGTGPTYRKIGGRVIYALEDLKSWADRGARLAASSNRSPVVTSNSANKALRSP